MNPFRALALLLIVAACGTTKPSAPRWSARIEPRNETEFILVVAGDVEARDEEIPVLCAVSPPCINPSILHLNLLYMLPPDRRLLQNVGPVNYRQPVGSATAIREVVVFSQAHPPAHVPVGE